MTAPAAAGPDLATLDSVQRRVLWLATAIVHHANRVRPNPSGVKVGGHQASSASMVSLMTALWFAHLEAPEHVVDRVEHRRRMRLHRDVVLGPQLGEPQRRHQAHHRRARRLVAAHLHARAVLANAVRVVDDRGREPEHAPLDGLERLEVRRRVLPRRRARDRGSTQAG